MKNRPRLWTDDELDFLKEYAPGHSQKEIVAEHNRRFPEIPRELSSIKSTMKRYGIRTGNDPRYKKGHVSSHTTKGTKLKPEHYEKCKRTMFGPEHLPAQTQPVGTEKRLSDGYVWVKVNDLPNVKRGVNWKKKQVVVWEQHNGPIPEGMFVTFLDGNRDNFDIHNLALVTRAEHARMNHEQLRSEDPEVTAAALKLARLKTKIGQLQRDRKE